MNIVFTGKFEIDGQHIVRELLIDACESKGWVIQKSVGWSTDYLVQAANGHGSIKTVAAIENNVQIISPETFWSMVKAA